MKLKPYNSEKILKYAEEIKSLYEKQKGNQEAYLHSIAKLGYEIYIVDDQKNGKRIGNAFRKTTISDDTVRKIEWQKRLMVFPLIRLAYLLPVFR